MREAADACEPTQHPLQPLSMDAAGLQAAAGARPAAHAITLASYKAADV